MNANPRIGRLQPTVPDDKPSTDAEAIASVLAGDVDRFEVLVRRYHPAMLRTAMMRIGDRQVAEDVVQDSLLAAFRGLKSYDSNYSFRTWLWAILANESRRRYGRMKKSVATLPGGSNVEEISSRVDPQALVAAEQLERVLQLLDRLPEKQAEAIRLRFAGELKYREIASLLDCSLATAKNRVKAGLLAMGKMVQSEERGIGPVSGRAAKDQS